MRILFATHEEKTHFLGMVPLAWAAHNAGHEVLVASQPALTDVIVSTGLTAVPVGRDHTLHRLLQLAAESGSRELDYDLSGDRPEKLTWEYLTAGYEEWVRWWWKIINDPMIDDLTDLCRSWRPDLVIWESLTFAAPIAARASGAAHARFVWSSDLCARLRAHYLRLKGLRPPAEQVDVLAAWLGDRAAAAGVPYSEELTRGQFTIDHVPPSLRLEVDLDYVPLRFVPYNGRSVVPRWLRTPPERPRVCLTLGTSSIERLGGYAVPVQELLDSLAELDAEIVVTLPREQQAALREVPANTRVFDFVPLNALAATCDVVVNHAGPGTVFTALAHGVPQLLLPYYIFDAPVLSEGLAKHGAGLTIPSHEVTGPAVCDAVRRLLDEPSFRQRAEELRRENRAAPSPDEVTRQLEELVSRTEETCAS
ncbi:activator-dependent family glycosyltransferase [Nonomuraea sp. SYSU D8015]|uniref:activator-dependent family glycosyltransferase n=1 Tax=Nonomuraea sp. SYSU D8015 TaxID=2593644 RepID=UPI0016609535|nr:activator-dependent family glycosyltransferase [Nonomuraea sp. SYSU D8015]